MHSSRMVFVVTPHQISHCQALGWIVAKSKTLTLIKSAGFSCTYGKVPVCFKLCFFHVEGYQLPLLIILPGCWARLVYLPNRCRTFSPTLCCLLKTFVLFNRKQQRQLLLFAYFPLRKAKCNSKVGQLFIFPIWSISWFFHSVYNINLLSVYWCLLLRSPFIVTIRPLFSVKLCDFSYFLALNFLA